MNEGLNNRRLFWHLDVPDARSPFCRYEIRPLKLTFHNRGLINLTDKEQKAYELLQELANLPELEVLQFESGNYPHIQFINGDDEYEGIYIDFTEGEWRRNGVKRSDVVRLAGTDDHGADSYQMFLALEAHLQLNQDIFITMSKDALSIRDDFNSYNIYTPNEALKIIGLFLRSRDAWTYWYQGGQVIADKREFYSILMRSKLPAMWKYHSECLEAGGYNGSLTTLASSITGRCYTLLQAKDELGKQFYGDADHEVILYHFNYFSLLIAGVLDAQARISHDVYQLNGSARGAGFNDGNSKKKFRKSIQAKVPALYNLISMPANAALIELVHCLRNTIHGSDHKAQQEVGHGDKLHVILSSEVAGDIWSYGQVLGCKERDGLYRREYTFTLNGIKQGKQVDVYVEPYNFSAFLLNGAFKLINDIAKVTDVAGKKNLPQKAIAMPIDWHDRADRFEMLGG
jgi:hypothetical protein